MRVFILAFILILSSTVCGEEIPQPKVNVVNPNVDFGRIMAGQKAEVIFEVGNSGQAPLKISNLRTSCGCTTALLDNSVIEPGMTARIKANLKTHGRMGQQRKIISFTTNDPLQPKVELVLTGKIQSRLKTNPDIVFFKSNMNKPVFVSINNYTFPTFEILAFSASSDKIEVRFLTPLKTPNPNQRLEINIKEGYPKSQINEKVALFTNDPLQPVIWIPIWGRTP